MYRGFRTFEIGAFPKRPHNDTSPWETFISAQHNGLSFFAAALKPRDKAELQMNYDGFLFYAFQPTTYFCLTTSMAL